MPETSAKAVSLPPRWTMAICAGLVLLSGVLSYKAALDESPTFDEPLHATAGYRIRWSGDYRVDVEDPALFPWLSSLPNGASDLHIDPSDPRLETLLHNHDRQWDIVIASMFRTRRPDGQSVYSGGGYINRGRIVFVGIDMILGALIAWWAYRLSGPVAAIIATGFFAFDPNFMAHGALVKNDAAMALLMLWLMHAIWRFGQRANVWSFLGISVACGLALNVKFSGILFPLLLAVAQLIRAMQRDAWVVGKWELKSRVGRVTFSFATTVVVVLLSVAIIWTVYGWRFSIAPDPSVQFDRAQLVSVAKLITSQGKISPADAQSAPLPITGRAILWIDDHRLLPDAWLHGLFYTWATSQYRSEFLLGRLSLTGWWYYFPLAMLFKTPVGTLVAMGFAGVGGIIRIIKRSHSSSNVWYLWLPIVVYGAIAMRTNLNLGLRHILPVYPFVYILVATSLGRFTQRSSPSQSVVSSRGTPRDLAQTQRSARSLGVPRDDSAAGHAGANSRWLLWIPAILIPLTAIETLASWPHEISFFNLACGRAKGGIRLLSDSNLDWGQDLPLLAQWQAVHPDRRLYLAYFGSADPHFYGIDYTQVAGGYPFSDLPSLPMNTPGVFAISATFLQGTYNVSDLKDQLTYLKSRQPIAILGGSIYLYDWNPAEFDGFIRAREGVTLYGDGL